MQFSALTVAAALVASAAAWGTNGTVSAVWVTDIVTALTTVCPASTQLTYNGITYTVTESTTLTITNCPCTVSKLATISPVVTVTPTYVAPSVPASVASSFPVTTPPAKTTAVLSATKPAVATFTGAAHRAAAGSAAGLAGLLGLAAYIL